VLVDIQVWEEASEVRASADDAQQRMEEDHGQASMPCAEERDLIIELLQTARQRWLSMRREASLPKALRFFHRILDCSTLSIGMRLTAFGQFQENYDCITVSYSVGSVVMAILLPTTWFCGLSHGRLKVHHICEDGWWQFPSLHISVILVGHYGSNCPVKFFDILNGLRDGVLVAPRLMSPSVVVLNVLGFPTLFRVDFETHLALVLETAGLINHLGAARLARPKLCLAMLTEFAPFPVAALVNILLVEAHGVNNRVPYAEECIVPGLPLLPWPML
jgi:hypothetical protein